MVDCYQRIEKKLNDLTLEFEFLRRIKNIYKVKYQEFEEKSNFISKSLKM